MNRARHYCPSCGAGLVSEPIGTALRCKHCGWHLITLAAWKRLPPVRQGYVMYMQSSWPTSELAGAQNPYLKDSSEWSQFNHGEQRAALVAQDSEE